MALVYDYETYWATRIQPQGHDFLYQELAFRWYEALRKLGLDIDFVAPGASLKGYKLAVVPCLMQVSDAALKAFAEADCLVLYGPRSGSRDRHFNIPENLPPGALAELTGIRVTQVASLRPGLAKPVKGKVSGDVVRWQEHVEATGEVLGRFENGNAALSRDSNHFYLAGWPEADLLSSALELIATEAGIATCMLPDHIRLRRRGNVTFAFNYGDEEWKSPGKGDFVLGGAMVPPQGISAWIDG